MCRSVVSVSSESKGSRQLVKNQLSQLVIDLDDSFQDRRQLKWVIDKHFQVLNINHFNPNKQDSAKPNV